jgi:molecular chaperone DnaK
VGDNAARNIGYGIDLGTTNSLVARCIGNRVEVLRNPKGFRETLPSVVSYRKGRTVVGDSALAYLEKAPGCVFAGFKRRMGTTDASLVEPLGHEVGPVELSAEVLRELRTFAPGEPPGALDEVVVSVPAAFDSAQSSATREAALRAGFREVALVQEPVAASLAYANHCGDSLEGGAPWLVYDLGGGTFDVALVRIAENEVAVIDHEGDSYLGGRDFDELIIDEILIPPLEQVLRNRDAKQMRRASSPYNPLYYKLTKLAEQARVELSTAATAIIEVEGEFGGREVCTEFELTRVDMEALICKPLLRTVAMIQAMLERRGMSPCDVRFVLMVGGATYTPLVRRLVADSLGIQVRCDIDPTNAIAVGAAHHASTHRRSRPAGQELSGIRAGLAVRCAYARASRNAEELLAVRVDGPTEGLSYRIERDDGGFDTGLRPVSARIHENLPLRPDSVNSFRFQICDRQGQTALKQPELIAITQGARAMRGQPLPHDISVEVDDLAGRATRLEVVFAKNSTLPLRKTLVRPLSATVLQDSDDAVHINVYEGDGAAEPAANRRIGQITITGRDLDRYIVKGSDIHLTFEIGESREIRATAVAEMADQEFADVFGVERHDVNIERLRLELGRLRDRICISLGQILRAEEYELADKLTALQEEANLLVMAAMRLSDDDVTDARFRIDDRKRRLLRDVSVLVGDRELAAARHEYRERVRDVLELAAERGTNEERRELARLVERHKPVVTGGNPFRIEAAERELRDFAHEIHWRQPEYHHWLYTRLTTYRFIDEEKASQLLEDGGRALEDRKHERLKAINNQLCSLLPDDVRDDLDRTERVGIA